MDAPFLEAEPWGRAGEKRSLQTNYTALTIKWHGEAHVPEGPTEPQKGQQLSVRWHHRLRSIAWGSFNFNHASISSPSRRHCPAFSVSLVLSVAQSHWHSC
ncbi:constitutive coactivator of PPAR-gamma-like protein 1 [Platysternon megacephalum]|uniref:Constitutive coactivator of PPAR-gamma-like protein 1 n=1 Tax=Platysternon megacephalum TaxID=55544 RepID=A0A4D9DW41_9SAUR|nr:constitutive coactivator of PPAR-gamma-like protein 1 [Platysternon megacephalum]